MAGISQRNLVHMQKLSVIELHRPCMGVDERCHSLQGDDEPEHQKSVESV